MPILETCWSPCFCYSNVKHGTIAVGIATIVIGIVGIVYTAWIIEGGQSSELYSPLFESDRYSSTPAAGGVLIAYISLFIIFSILLIYGTRNDIRGLLIPWMLWMAILVLYMTALGIWFIARYYTYPISVVASIFTWLFAAVNFYCLLCVMSQYQVLKRYQSANIVMLYP